MTPQDKAITSNPLRRGGRPCVRDLRISVVDVLGWLAQGQTIEQILADYPELTSDDIRACLSYAAERESHEVRLATSECNCYSTRTFHDASCRACKAAFR